MANHEHDWLETTALGDRFRTWMCNSIDCDATAKEIAEPTTVEALDDMGYEHWPCGPCPRCDGKDHCDDGY